MKNKKTGPEEILADPGTQKAQDSGKRVFVQIENRTFDSNPGIHLADTFSCIIFRVCISSNAGNIPRLSTEPGCTVKDYTEMIFHLSVLTLLDLSTLMRIQPIARQVMETPKKKALIKAVCRYRDFTLSQLLSRN